MINPVGRNLMAQAVIKGPDGSAATDPTIVVRQGRRGTAKLIRQNMGRELMDAGGGNVSSPLHVTPSKIDIMV